MAIALTCDVFSALIDSRSGAAPVFEVLARQHGWRFAGDQLYAAWDRRHKQLQAGCRVWVPFAELARQALADIVGDGAPIEALWASLPSWPLWPDVADTIPRLAQRYRVGVLSNVDDALLARTQVAALPVDPGLILTSERLRLYKPSTAFYRAAADTLSEPFTHVAASARDVRGALEAGIDTIRIVRPGHHLDPDGPRPAREINNLAELIAADDPKTFTA